MAFTCENQDLLVQNNSCNSWKGIKNLKPRCCILRTSGISHTTSWKINKVVKKKYEQVANGFQMSKPWPSSSNTTHATYGRESKIWRPIAVFYGPLVFPILHNEKKIKYSEKKYVQVANGFHMWNHDPLVHEQLMQLMEGN